MTNGRRFDKPGTYHIQVKGNLDQRWSDWFDGFRIMPQPGDECLEADDLVQAATVAAAVVYQAAQHPDPVPREPPAP